MTEPQLAEAGPLPERFAREILPYFPSPLKNWLAGLSQETLRQLEEIRLRVHRPIICQVGGRSAWLNDRGQLVALRTGTPFLLCSELMQKVVALISQSSLYALETELSQGYLTLKGGHRVGFTGEAILHRGKITGMKHLSSLNFRIARQIPGAADGLVRTLIDETGDRIYHTLIISPPRAGKTTILRDLVRQISDGIPGLWSGANVGLVDERSEIAGSYQGIPQLDIGMRTDVLDGCPKAEGMLLLLRSMSPQVIAVDELGRKEDIDALLEMLNAGVSVIATVHGSSASELQQRPHLGSLIKDRVFERLVILSRRLGPGTIEKIYRGDLTAVVSPKPEVKTN
ncbi:MAG TPA: stage III sporulation protein AA [Clostridia bacterium]|nr:stage III sporulation protein AA [Clostridia bacterium]